MSKDIESVYTLNSINGLHRVVTDSSPTDCLVSSWSAAYSKGHAIGGNSAAVIIAYPDRFFGQNHMALYILLSLQKFAVSRRL